MLRPNVIVPVSLQEEERHREGLLTEKRPCEDVGRKQPFTSQRNSQMRTTLPAPWSWTSSFKNSEKISFHCLSHLVCGIHLWQPKQTNILQVWSLHRSRSYESYQFFCFFSSSYSERVCSSSIYLKYTCHPKL